MLLFQRLLLNSCRVWLKQIPVYKGAEFTLLGEPSKGNGAHGKDALGDVTLPGVDPVDTELFQKEHAAVALTKLVSQSPGMYETYYHSS